MTITIKELAAAAGMSQRALARRFGIPYRTMEDWSSKGTCPKYIIKMMEEILLKEANMDWTIRNTETGAVQMTGICGATEDEAVANFLALCPTFTEDEVYASPQEWND